MKILLATILCIVCLCQVKTSLAEDVSTILIELHDSSMTNLSTKFIEDPTNYLFPIISINFFEVFNKDLYKDKRFTHVFTEKHPTASSMLGVRLRVNVAISN